MAVHVRHLPVIGPLPDTDWCHANAAEMAMLDLLAEILAEEYIARMKATTLKSEELSNESSDLRTI